MFHRPYGSGREFDPEALSAEKLAVYAPLICADLPENLICRRLHFGRMPEVCLNRPLSWAGFGTVTHVCR